MGTLSGTVTLANSRLSLVAGTAFVDFSATGTLTPYLNGKLTVTDSAGKKAVGYLKAAGRHTIGRAWRAGLTITMRLAIRTQSAHLAVAVYTI